MHRTRASLVLASSSSPSVAQGKTRRGSKPLRKGTPFSGLVVTTLGGHVQDATQQNDAASSAVHRITPALEGNRASFFLDHVVTISCRERT